jgi:large subunit ribosomal protein L15
MQLNTLKPAPGSKTKRVRVGRGIGSGIGKTCGKGHKGQKARAGGYHKTGFEGGQMPMQRRLPKFGFVSRQALLHHKIRLNELNQLSESVVNLKSLKAANIIAKSVKTARVFGAGKLEKAFVVQGIKVTKSARVAIEAAGGKVEAE